MASKVTVTFSPSFIFATSTSFKERVAISWFVIMEPRVPEAVSPTSTPTLAIVPLNGAVT